VAIRAFSTGSTMSSQAISFVSLWLRFPDENLPS
jgi:hypothetical protein